MRIRKIVSGTAEQPRMTVYRSNKQIYVQFIDDLAGVTLATASSLDKEVAEAAAGEFLREVVRRVDDQQVCKGARQVRRDLKRVAADGAVAHGVERDILRNAQAAREIFRRVLRQEVDCLVAFGFHGVTSL